MISVNVLVSKVKKMVGLKKSAKRSKRKKCRHKRKCKC